MVGGEAQSSAVGASGRLSPDGDKRRDEKEDPSSSSSSTAHHDDDDDEAARRHEDRTDAAVLLYDESYHPPFVWALVLFPPILPLFWYVVCIVGRPYSAALLPILVAGWLAFAFSLTQGPLLIHRAASHADSVSIILWIGSNPPGSLSSNYARRAPPLAAAASSTQDLPGPGDRIEPSVRVLVRDHVPDGAPVQDSVRPSRPARPRPPRLGRVGDSAQCQLYVPNDVLCRSPSHRRETQPD
jgi:hypothetical protein